MRVGKLTFILLGVVVLLCHTSWSQSRFLVDCSQIVSFEGLGGHPARPEIITVVSAPDFDIVLMNWNIQTQIPCMMRVDKSGIPLDTIPILINPEGGINQLQPRNAFWYHDTFWITGIRSNNSTSAYRRFSPALSMLDTVLLDWSAQKYSEVQLQGDLLWGERFEISCFDLQTMQFRRTDTTLIPSAWRGGNIRQSTDSGLFCVNQKSGTATFYTRFVSNDGIPGPLDSITPLKPYLGNYAYLRAIVLSPTSLLVWYFNDTGLDTFNLCYFTIEKDAPPSEVGVIHLDASYRGMYPLISGRYFPPSPISLGASSGIFQLLLQKYATPNATLSLVEFDLSASTVSILSSRTITTQFEPVNYGKIFVDSTGWRSFGRYHRQTIERLAADWSDISSSWREATLLPVPDLLAEPTIGSDGNQLKLVARKQRDSGDELVGYTISSTGDSLLSSVLLRRSSTAIDAPSIFFGDSVRALAWTEAASAPAGQGLGYGSRRHRLCIFSGDFPTEQETSQSPVAVTSSAFDCRRPTFVETSSGISWSYSHSNNYVPYGFPSSLSPFHPAKVFIAFRSSPQSTTQLGEANFSGRPTLAARGDTVLFIGAWAWCTDQGNLICRTMSTWTRVHRYAIGVPATFVETQHAVGIDLTNARLRGNSHILGLGGQLTYVGRYDWNSQKIEKLRTGGAQRTDCLTTNYFFTLADGYLEVDILLETSQLKLHFFASNWQFIGSSTVKLSAKPLHFSEVVILPNTNSLGIAYTLYNISTAKTELWLEKIPFDIPTEAEENEPAVPREIILSQNYPNPFNPSTTISFSLPLRENVRLTIVNILGQEVVELLNSPFAAGEHQIVWDGKSRNGMTCASGIYFYQLETDSDSRSRKMLLLK